MKKQFLFLVTIVMFFVSTQVGLASPFSYDFVDLRVQIGETNDADGVGVQAAIVKDIYKGVFALGSYQYTTANDVDYWADNLLLAAGYHMPLNKQADMVFTGGFLVSWWENNYNDDSDTGVRLTAGSRYQFDPKFEAYGEFIYISVFDESDIGISISGLFNLNKAISFGGEFSSVGDTSLVSGIFRFNF